MPNARSGYGRHNVPSLLAATNSIPSGMRLVTSIFRVHARARIRQIERQHPFTFDKTALGPERRTCSPGSMIRT